MSKLISQSKSGKRSIREMSCSRKKKKHCRFIFAAANTDLHCNFCSCKNKRPFYSDKIKRTVTKLPLIFTATVNSAVTKLPLIFTATESSVQ